MFKKSLLVASVLGVGAIASGVAFADAGMSSTYCKPGFYAGVQAGRGDTHYGFEDVLPEVKTVVDNLGSSYSLGASHIDDTGTSGRLFAGYQFNPYWAVEAGYTKFHKTDFSVTKYYTYSSTTTPYTYYAGEVTEQATDVVAKLTMPFQYGFGGYLKGGLALVSADRHINESDSNSSNYNAIPTSTFYSKSYQAVRPTYGAGLDYTIPNTSLDVDVSYTEIARGDGIPRASLWALGLTDKFA